MGLVAGLVALSLAASCTLYHSKIPIAETGDAKISPDAVFVTEDDSGLAILGIFVVSEPDHYSVLTERARRRYNCERLHHVQLDFYSDYWLFVGFPIARITAVCERAGEQAPSDSASPATPPATPPAAPKPPTPAPDGKPAATPTPASPPEATTLD